MSLSADYKEYYAANISNSAGMDAKRQFLLLTGTAASFRGSGRYPAIELNRHHAIGEIVLFYSINRDVTNSFRTDM